MLSPMSTSAELEAFRKEAIEEEEVRLSPYATFSKNHLRLGGSDDDHRLPYKRDVDRIVHSKAYARYIDKTQVVYLVQNDHITHRGLHVQLVSNFARGIAEILRLNLDLVEAIALGHDVGHPPFGHEGEIYLSALSVEHGEGAFAHPAQSCRLFAEIEPLNLGLEVYDGFLTHDGGMKDRITRPKRGKTWKEHHEEIARRAKEPEVNLAPMSLEGCLVKMCDTMSYLGRDIEDAVSLGIIDRSEVPKTFLGSTNREILKNLAQDLIKSSKDKDEIAISEACFEALWALRKFNFERIYNHPKLKVESNKIKTAYRILFEWLLSDFNKHEERSFLGKNFLQSKSERYNEQSSPEKKVIDFIAGMTDSYFVKTFEMIFVPKQIDLCAL